MKFKLSIIAVLLAALLVWGPVNARGQETTSFEEMEVQLFELINAARSNPLLMAWLLGKDPNQVRADLPWLPDHLSPLQLHSALTDAARSHTQDMLALDYYGYDSPEGNTPEDRIREAGYLPEKSGETLGLLGFINFVKPADAVNKIFSRMFLDELSPDRVRPRNILDPDLQDVGIGFGAGTLTIEGVSYNAYLVTCDFATSAPSVLEMELLALINQARENPLGMAQILGLDPQKTLDDLPELRDILMQGLPPLVYNSKLYRSASYHFQDMIKNDYFSEQSLDGTTPAERIARTGYEAEAAGEVIESLLSSDDCDEEEVAFQIFAAKFKDELDPESETEPDILNATFREGGVRFDLFELSQEGDGPGTYGFMVVDLAKSALPARPSLMGVVYSDVNQDGLYGPGEGIANVFVTVQGGDGPYTVMTNAVGRFTLELDPGLYTITVEVDGFTMEREANLEGENLGLWFNISSIPGMNE